MHLHTCDFIFHFQFNYDLFITLKIYPKYFKYYSKYNFGTLHCVYILFQNFSQFLRHLKQIFMLVITWIDHQNTAVKPINVVYSISKSDANSALARIDRQKCWFVHFLTEFAPQVSGWSQINSLDDRSSALCTFALS